MTRPEDKTEEYESALAEAKRAKYVLRLYVSGTTPRSLKAIEALRQICEEHLAGRYEIEIVDIFQHPELARDHQVIAAPTLVKRLPLPLRRLIGDLSDVDRILKGLEIRQEE